MTVPDAVEPPVFATALREIALAIGAEWVFVSDEDLELYRDDYSPQKNLPQERRASAAVAPANSEQVQAVVRIANKYKIPLYPISTGKNLGYGGAAPSMSGCVVVDLKRMNRVVEIDEDRCFKDAVDPNGILSPGRYGIWPKGRRKTAAAQQPPAVAVPLKSGGE